ncbi:MAG: hypothetical protein ABMA64_06935 [Myxococcota bacterium]
MKRAAWVVTLVVVALASAGSKLSRLSDDEYSEYRALRVFMNDDEQKQWLKLKTPEERKAWLEEHGLYQKFWSHDEEVRKQIVEGEVENGWSRDMVYMAWGPPFQKQRLTGREAERSELLVYRFEIDEDGVATPLYDSKRTNYKAVRQHQTEVYVDDDVVTSMVEKDRWE